MLLNKQIIVFPTSRAKREYIKYIPCDSILPTLLTIDNFFNKITYFEEYTQIDENQKLFFLLEAVKNVDLKKLGILSNFNIFLKQSDYIFKFLDELSLENINIEELNQYDTYDFYSEHLTILKAIRDNYIEVLEKNKKIDKINFRNHYKLNEIYLKTFEKIIFKFEGYLNELEFELLLNVSKIIPTQIEFYYYNFNKKSISKFINIGFDLEINHFYTIDLTNLVVIKKEPIINLNQNVVINEFENRINQIAFIKKSIYDLVQSGQKPQDIVLILPDETFAKTLALFDNEKYFNFASGFDILQSNFIHIQSAIYNYLLDSYEKNNLEYLQKYVSVDEIDEFITQKQNEINKSLFDKYIEFISKYIDSVEIKEKFENVIYKFSSLIFKYEIKLSLQEMIKIILDLTSEISVDDNNGGKITVIGLLETRNVSFKNVIIVDFNEEFIPKISKKDKFLSSSLKEKIGLPTSNDRENLQKFYYKRLCDNAGNLYISYVNNDISKPSRFLNIVDNKKQLQNEKNLDFHDILYSNNKIIVLEEKKEMLFSTTAFKWSASSLKTFFECRRKFYYKYILQLHLHDIELYPKGFELGNFVHNFLEYTYKNYDINLMNFQKVFNEFLSSQNILNPFLLFEIAIWKEKIQSFINIDKLRLQNGEKVLALEKVFNFSYKGLNFGGKIDRVDERNETYFIIDYKTSSNLKVDNEKNVEETNDFQMEIYFLYLKDEFRTDYIDCLYYDLNNSMVVKETLVDKKIELLDEKIKELIVLDNSVIDFKKCEDTKKCQMCEFSNICNR